MLNKPVFWSKKKKIKILEDYLINMKSQVTDIEEALAELKK